MGLAGRSPRELAFRLGQAAGNLRIWASPPERPTGGGAGCLPLPDPEAVARGLKGSSFETEILRLAGEIAEHRFPLFGGVLPTGPEIAWRRDYRRGIESGLSYFKLIPYLDAARVGDHKNIWELNRHQHLAVLAQAYLFTGNADWLGEIERQLGSWHEQNPFLKGMNWTSALEVAFRALSWLWVDHLTGGSIAVLDGLYRHGVYLQNNLSTYFSPNTHLLGEGVALHAIGLKLNREKWRVLGARIVQEELARQVKDDGSYFEQSTYYHVYALDFFVMHYLLAGRPTAFEAKLRAMARFLAAAAGPARSLPCLGDDDGGRLFHPYGPRERFARATLATCAALFPDAGLPCEKEDRPEQAAWLLNAPEAASVPAWGETRFFPDSGLAAMAHGDLHVLVDAGPFGPGGAGHSHADTLSLTVRFGEREILIDPGTFSYVGDAGLRNTFRGTAFHNTIRVDGRDQADPAGPFRWQNKPDVRVRQWETRPGLAYLDAECSYRGFTHQRRVLVSGADAVFVLDEITGQDGEHDVEQFWHLGFEDAPVLFSDPAAMRREWGERSRVFGEREPAAVARAAWRTALPHVCGAAIWLGKGSGAELTRAGYRLAIAGEMTVSFGEGGFPAVTRA